MCNVVRKAQVARAKMSFSSEKTPLIPPVRVAEQGAAKEYLDKTRLSVSKTKKKPKLVSNS